MQCTQFRTQRIQRTKGTNADMEKLKNLISDFFTMNSRSIAYCLLPIAW